MKYSVIVAEDEELLLNNLVQKIERADSDFHVVGTAQTGVQAYALIEELNPEVLVTDIRMPVMDGIALIAKVREHFPLIKCIITSGFSDFEYARSAITLCVSDYLLKPLDSDCRFSCQPTIIMDNSIHALPSEEIIIKLIHCIQRHIRLIFLVMESH